MIGKKDSIAQKKLVIKNDFFPKQQKKENQSYYLVYRHSILMRLSLILMVQ